MNWGRRVKTIITRNWREKLIAVVLAFLFWYLIRVQIGNSNMPFPIERHGRATRL